MVITHSFSPIGTKGLSHAVGTAYFSIVDTTTTTVYGSTIFANTGLARCPLPGVPVELIRDNGQVMNTNSAADGTFSFSIALEEPVQLRIPPFNGFSWSVSYYPIKPAKPPQRKLLGKTPSPTATPTLMHYSTPKMVHRFTFDRPSPTSMEQIPDIVDATYYATIHNGVTISDSRAIFVQSSNPGAQPYLSLFSGWFGVADAISIEMWVTVDIATQDNALLFSFGNPADSKVYKSLHVKGFQGFVNTYIAVIIDPPQEEMRVYVNGTLSISQNIPSTPLFNGEGASEEFNLIGWDLKKTTPGFIGSINEIRFWDGALTSSSITETAVLGVDPTIVKLGSNDTLYNIQIDYLVTSEVDLTIGFYGGLSRNKMFGSESIFLVKALDPQCAFNASIALDPTKSAASSFLPAMNYSVTLLPYNKPLPAPKFSYSLCSMSLDPYSYLQAADELSVEIYTDLLTTGNLDATFIYLSGLCLNVSGGEHFATSLPTPDKEGRACYSNSVTMLNRGQIWPLEITLFELYPAYSAGSPSWFSGSSNLDISGGTTVKELLVLDSTVEITDMVSGSTSPTTYSISTMMCSIVAQLKLQ